MDRLSALLQRFDLRARVFHTGLLCGNAHHPPDGARLHLLRQGALTVSDGSGPTLVLDEPAVLFYPRPLAHQLATGAAGEAALVSAHIDFGVGDENPLLRHLPARLVVPLANLPGLATTQALLFDEAFGARCGHAGVVDRLAEVLVVQVLRHAIAERLVDGGLLAGLADERLARALSAVHADPGRGWTLDTMAGEAGMSRARFAARFAAVLGLPPGEYLTQWRLGLARSMLRRGLPVKRVAQDVGYGSASALARVFGQRLGVTPTAWRAES